MDPGVFLEHFYRMDYKREPHKGGEDLVAAFHAAALARRHDNNADLGGPVSLGEEFDLASHLVPAPRLSKDDPSCRGLQDPDNGHVVNGVYKSPSPFYYDHRPIIQIADALADLLAFLNDVDG